MLLAAAGNPRLCKWARHFGQSAVVSKNYDDFCYPSRVYSIVWQRCRICCFDNSTVSKNIVLTPGPSATAEPRVACRLTTYPHGPWTVKDRVTGSVPLPGHRVPGHLVVTRFQCCCGRCKGCAPPPMDPVRSWPMLAGHMNWPSWSVPL